MTFYPPCVLISIVAASLAGILAWLQAPGQERRKPSARTIRRRPA